MERTFIGKLEEHIGKQVLIAGFIDTKRDHGKVAFLDIRDSSGKIQSVATASQSFFSVVSGAKEQSAVRVTGTIVNRPEKLITEGLNGGIEMQIEHLEIVSVAKEFPWGSQSSDDVNEELRMKYRYLDLRSERLQKNLKLRSNVTQFIRNFLINEGFYEIETPFITKGTPEGAREYIIPSRLQPGSFYALPQSPQQFKQLMMVGGLDRYFQIVRCFRDEDSRGDRQPEFTQLDLEMSFVDQETILQLTERLFTELVHTVTPEKKLTFSPFQRLTYAESMEKYGTDKPDLRKDKTDPNEIAFAFITDFPLFEYDETEKKLAAVHHLFTRPKAGDEALLETNPIEALSASYDIVINGYELGSGSIRIHEPELQVKIFDVLGISKDEAQARFGHMLEAFSYGAPPHGGIAPGIDRLVMILAGEPNIREVIAFPKTGDGRDLMMDAPAPVAEKQLRELHIKTTEQTPHK